MPKILVCLNDREEHERIASELRLKKFTVSVGDPVQASEDPKTVAARMRETRADVAVVDYIPEDAHSVKMLQDVTDIATAPKFIFILPSGVDASHILMAVNEGAAAILQPPVNVEALANYIERAINGPGRFRYEVGRETSAIVELAKIEQHTKAAQMQLASMRKLVSFLMSTSVSSQHRTALVVSDSAYQRDYLRKLLEDHGFSVCTATKPEEGIDKALEENPRVVISDLEMEGMNGVQFCYDLKIKHKFVPCYFVICTANSDKIDEVMAPGNGVDACVVKPTGESDNIELVSAAAMGLLL